MDQSQEVHHYQKGTKTQDWYLKSLSKLKNSTFWKMLRKETKVDFFRTTMHHFVHQKTIYQSLNLKK